MTVSTRRCIDVGRHLDLAGSIGADVDAVSSPSAPRWINWFTALLLVGSLVVPIVLMRRKSITYDEVPHLSAGVTYWKTGEVQLNPMHPPLVKELSALPLLMLGVSVPLDPDEIRQLADETWNQREFGWRFFARNDVERTVFWGRVPAVVLSAGLATLVLAWARELWGPLGGLLAVFLYVFDPTIVAHSQLVTTDVGLAFFGTLFLYLLRRTLRAPSWAGFVATGMALGLALGAKFSALLLLPIAFVLLIVTAVERKDQTIGSVAFYIAGVGALGAVAYAVLWAVYLFPVDPLFYVKAVRSLKGDLSPEYLYYFKGEFGRQRWWDYFLVAWLIKTPLPELAVIFLGIVGFASGERRGALDEAFLWVPAIVYAVAYSLSAEPIGVRYWIACFPLLFISAGRVGKMLGGVRRWVRGVVFAFCAWQAIEFAMIWPDHLSYFNQSVGGYRGGLAWLDDSNVDWGQGLIELRDYLNAHSVEDYHFCYFGNLNPKAYGIRGRLTWFDSLLEPPAPGTWVLSAFCVARIQAHLRIRFGDGPLNWLRYVEPKAIVGHAYYVYEIRPGDLFGEAPAGKDYPVFPRFPEQ